MKNSTWKCVLYKKQIPACTPEKHMEFYRRIPIESQILLSSFSQKVERWIDIFIDYWIRRDWRGSNPQLPPWQGGALTNWTTIPGNSSRQYPFFLWFDSRLLTTRITSKFYLFQMRRNLSIKNFSLLKDFLLKILIWI